MSFKPKQFMGKRTIHLTKFLGPEYALQDVTKPPCLKKFFEVASQKKCRLNPSYNMLLEEKSVDVDEVEILVKINEVYAGVFQGEFTGCPVSFLAYDSKERAIQAKGLLSRF